MKLYCYEKEKKEERKKITETEVFHIRSIRKWQKKKKEDEREYSKFENLEFGLEGYCFFFHSSLEVIFIFILAVKIIIQTESITSKMMFKTKVKEENRKWDLLYEGDALALDRAKQSKLVCCGWGDEQLEKRER